MSVQEEQYQEQETWDKPLINWRPFWTRYAIPLLLFTALIALFILLPRSKYEPYPTEPWENRNPYQYRGSFNRDFNDLNDAQLRVAKDIGIEPAATREILAGRRKLVDISDSKNYRLDDLTHSAPLLVPVAADLLNEIGEKFWTTLQRDTLPLYLPIVTSVTRTGEDIKDLSRGNTNASENSTHQYGTTFDISWKRFHKLDAEDPRTIPEEELKHLLAIVLRDFQKGERAYIKHERQQACFHITVRK